MAVTGRPIHAREHSPIRIHHLEHRRSAPRLRHQGVRVAFLHDALLCALDDREPSAALAGRTDGAGRGDGLCRRRPGRPGRGHPRPRAGLQRLSDRAGQDAAQHQPERQILRDGLRGVSGGLRRRDPLAVGRGRGRRREVPRHARGDQPTQGQEGALQLRQRVEPDRPQALQQFGNHHARRAYQAALGGHLGGDGRRTVHARRCDRPHLRD